MGATISVRGSQRSRKYSSRAITHPALLNNEILARVFSVADATCGKTYRATCARAARVCRTWNEPASRAIWATRPWHLFDLLHILLPDPPPLDASGFASEYKLQQYLRTLVKEKTELYVQPIVWDSFVRCCARTRELFVPRLGTEAVILRLLLKLNNETFFSSQSLSWQESPCVDGLLTALVPRSLETLQISIDPDTEMPPEKLRKLITELSDRAPTIRCMVIQTTDEARSFPVGAIIKHVHLHHLTLGGDIAISSADFRTLLSLPYLDSLHVSLTVDVDDATGGIETTRSLSLRQLSCTATCTTATSLLYLLDAPSLEVLSLHVDEPRFEYRIDAHSDLLRAVAVASFATGLRSLAYTSANIYSDLAPKAHPSISLTLEDIPAHPKSLSTHLQSISDLLGLFFPDPRSIYLPLLQHFSFDMFWPVKISGEDVLQLGAAFGAAARVLEHTPFLSSLRGTTTVGYPTHLATGRRLAERCPEGEVFTMVVEYDWLYDLESPTESVGYQFGVEGGEDVGYAL